MKRFSNWAIALLVIYAISGVIRAWHDPSGAHGQRQVDTLGMSMLLAQEFRAGELVDGIFYPRILEKGLSNGINATEFPLLNLLTFPLFFFGPATGTFLASLFVFILNWIAAVYFLPRLWRAWNINLPVWLAVLTYFSIPSIEFQTPIFMPEGLGFPLLVAGAAFLCEKKWLRSFCLLTLSVAVKPPFVTAFLPLAIYPFLFRKKIRVPHFIVLASALVFPLWWYTLHAHLILLQAQGGQIFAFLGFKPVERLAEVGVLGSLKLVFHQILFGHFPIYTGALLYPLSLWVSPVLALCLLPMLVGAIALLGAPIAVHFYYFAGAGLLALLLMGKCLDQKRKAITALALIAVFWGALYSIRTNIWVSSRTDDWWSLSKPFEKLISKDSEVVTDDVLGCPTKLMRVARAGTLAPDTFAEICRQAGYRERPLSFLLDEENYLREKRPGNCIEEATTIHQEKRAFGSWILLSWSPKAKTTE